MSASFYKKTTFDNKILLLLLWNIIAPPLFSPLLAKKIESFMAKLIFSAIKPPVYIALLEKIYDYLMITWFNYSESTVDLKKMHDF